MRELYAQGDLLIERVADVRPSGRAIAPDVDGSVVLAEGEVTGHRHQIFQSVTAFRDDGLASFIHRGCWFDSVDGDEAVGFA